MFYVKERENLKLFEETQTPEWWRNANLIKQMFKWGMELICLLSFALLFLEKSFHLT